MANSMFNRSTNRDRNRRNNQVFNRSIVKKTSAMLSLMLIIAIMVPVLAFAATGFTNLTYKDGTVSGSVYSSIYTNTDSIYVNVSDPSTNGLLTTSKAVYSNTYDSTKGWYYNFTGSLSNAYLSVNVTSVVYRNGAASPTISESAYGSVNNTTSSRSSSGGGGYFPGTTTVNGSTLTVGIDGFVDANSLSNALASGSVTLKISGDTASIPASALVDASGKTITVTNDNGSFVLPVSVLKLADLAKALGVDVKDLKIKVSITKVTGATAEAVKAAATAAGGTQVADAVDFKVVAEGKDGKTVDVNFGNTYVSRSLNVSKAVDSKNATGVLYNESTKKVSFVPATFSTVDGKTVATLKRNGNSIYTVIEVNKSFADVASHWSKADVELLANKLVVDGSTDTTFEPERNINRAEFAALVVRSLGLTPAATASNFKDVKSDAWYASTVATATYAGIINGYEDNTFRPDAQITREELAAMVIRAMSFADISTNVSEPKSVLSKFKDSDKIVWAQQEVANAINAGIINGLTDTTIGSTEKATRAQAATMLKRFLAKANFIN